MACSYTARGVEQRAEVATIASDTLQARRKRKAELDTQRKAANAALQEERAKAIAGEELKQRRADVRARKIAQEDAEAKLAAGGERWKEVRCVHTSRLLGPSACLLT